MLFFDAASNDLTNAATDSVVGRGAVCGRLEDAGHMPRYTRYVFKQVMPFLKGRICEIGSGSGRFTQFLANYESVTAVEPSGAAHLLALQSSAYQLNIRHVRCELDDCPNEQVPADGYDTVLCLNLLEHLEYDITALEILGDLISAKGHVIVLVPACSAVFGALDRARGHLRRYSRRVLSEAFNEAGLEVTRSFYFNLPGMLAWWSLSRLFKRRRISPTAARFLDGLVPALETTERFLKPPVGHSLLMIGKRY